MPLRMRSVDETRRRIKFETEQISSMQERIAGLEATATKERATVARLALDKETTQAEHEALQVEIDSAKDALEELTAVLIVKTTAFKEVKKQGSKSARALDKVLKEIAACVSFSFRSMSDSC